MDFYQIDILISILRIVIVFAFSFVLLQKVLLIPAMKRAGGNDPMLTWMLIPGLLLVVSGTLVLLRLYDTVLLFTVLGLITVNGVFFRYGGFSKFIYRFNVRIFRILDSGFAAKKVLASAEATLHRRLSQYTFRMSHLLFAVILTWSVLVRLWPGFIHAAPFAIETYGTIEHASVIATNSFSSALATTPIGLPLLINSLHQITRIDIGILVHFFGVLSVVLLMLSIFFVVRAMTHNSYAGLFGMSLWGLFYKLLPLTAQQQVEGNSVLLATAFAIPTIFLGYQAFVEKKSMGAVGFAVGIFLVLLTNRFVTMMLILAVCAFFMALLFFNRSAGKISSIKMRTILLVLTGFAGVFLLFYLWVTDEIMRLEITRLLFFDELFNRYSINRFQYPEILSFRLFWLSGVVLLILAYLDKQPVNSVIKAFFAFYTFLLLLLWQPEWFQLQDILNWRQVGFYMAAVLCIDASLILHDLFVPILRMPVLSKMQHVARPAIMIILLTTVAVLVKPRTVVFSYTPEPDGFVKAVYKIKKEMIPYHWTAISHFGTKSLILNNGRFMDYQYFLQNYSRVTSGELLSTLIPTEHLFVFTEKDSISSSIDTGLLPNMPLLMTELNRWCKAFMRNSKSMSVYYEDGHVRIYHIDNRRSANMQLAGKTLKARGT